MLAENIKADSEQLNKEQRGKRLSPSTLAGGRKPEPEGLGNMREMAAEIGLTGLELHDGRLGIYLWPDTTAQNAWRAGLLPEAAR
jgi:hypothetical protein